jgi:hypothetical protein
MIHTLQNSVPRRDDGDWCALVITAAQIVGALLAPGAPMVQYSIPLTGHYIINLLAISSEQLGEREWISTPTLNSRYGS